MTFCFDGYSFSSSSSSCVETNSLYCSNSCKGFNGRDGCNGLNGYIDHHGYTGFENHNDCIGIFDNIDLSERPGILT